MSNFWNIKYNSNTKDSYFSKGKYHFFYEPEKNDKALKVNLFEFNVTVDEEISVVSIVNYLKDIDSDLILLDKYPCKTVDLIKNYDNNIENIYLFHDLKTEYVLFVVPEYLKGERDSIAFIGITILDKKIRFAIKTFNFNIISDIYKVLIEKIKSTVNILNIKYEDNIKWLVVNKYKVLEKNSSRTPLENTILKDSINPNHEDMYRALFLLLIKKGYITSEDRKDIAKLSVTNGSKIRKILRRYLKLPVEEGKATLIHDESANDIETDDKNAVYTFSASGWKYFMNNWFEDFVGQVLKELKGVKIERMQPESEFNFKESENKSDKMEIDWLVLATSGGVSKVICIECKRTMSNTTLNKIRTKYENKLIKTSNYDVIDGFINVGLFLPYKNNTNLKINELNVDNISVGSIEKTFITFVADKFQSFVDNMQNAIVHILKEE